MPIDQIRRPTFHFSFCLSVSLSVWFWPDTPITPINVIRKSHAVQRATKLITKIHLMATIQVGQQLLAKRQVQCKCRYICIIYVYVKYIFICISNNLLSLSLAFFKNFNLLSQQICWVVKRLLIYHFVEYFCTLLPEISILFPICYTRQIERELAKNISMSLSD